MLMEPDMVEYRRQFRKGAVLRGEDALDALNQPWRLVPHKKTGFNATVQTWSCQRLLLARAQGDGTIMYRDEEHLGDGYDNFVLVVLIHKGGLTCSQRGRTATAGQGSVVTLLPKESYWSNALDGIDATMLYVPLDYLERRGVATDALAAESWAGGPLVAGVRALVDSTLELQDDALDRRPIHIEEALLELVVGMLGRHLQRHTDIDAPAEEVRRKVFAAIAANYSNPAYDVSAIVAETGVSRRYMYKVFEGRNATVGSILRARRLDEAEVLLRAYGQGASLARIGKTVGFHSGESFSRAYKESRGITPAQYRDRHKADAARAKR
ncbi:AraC family transcriptional regulator [Arthrobacter sp. HY1533]|uniref:AraC family transcriptional regulator n=1 Tax=Arthrobacter sp. HY1533 TaxID=2970919 RepID=UPI0022B9F5F9|nr:helix-turn-helix transcriptional regulator [Arthrobacter sp. HY1533]